MCSKTLLTAYYASSIGGRQSILRVEELLGEKPTKRQLVWYERMVEVQLADEAK